MPLLSQYFTGTTTDGENWMVLKPFEFTALGGRHFRVREGATTDGPSIPHFLGSLVDRTGAKWIPAVCHDAAYRLQLEEDINGDWISVALPKEDCDSIFRELLIANGVPEALAETLYQAVNRFGFNAFEEDRKR